VLGESHDRRRPPRVELGERDELRILRLLDLRLDGPAVRAAVRMAEALVDPLDHLVGERVAELVGVDVGLRGRIPHEVGQEPLDDPVLTNDALRPFGPDLGEDGLFLLAALHEPIDLEALQHLTRRGARHSEHLGDSGGNRGRSGRRPVLADREREEVDRLEVLVDRMTLRACHVCLRVDGLGVPQL
jgi:hypothetical protein